MLVIDSQEDYDRLAAHAQNEEAYPTGAAYTNLGTDPWLAVMLTRNEKIANDQEVPLNYMTFTRNGGTMTKPTEWDGASISSALSAYIGNAPAGDEGGHAFGQGTLSGTYKVEVGYMGVTYTDEVMHTHTGEDVYRVTFDLNGGTSNAPSDQIILNNTPATKPSDPTLDGYYFVGWYADKAGTNEWDFTNNINHNTTLFAKWESSTVTTEAELTAALAAEAKTITVGADITLNSDIIVPDGTTLTVPAGKTLTVTSDTFTNYGTIRNAGTLEGTAPTGDGKVITVVSTADELHAALTDTAVDNIEVQGKIEITNQNAASGGVGGAEDGTPMAYRIIRPLTISGGNDNAEIVYAGQLDNDIGARYMFAVRQEAGENGNLTLSDLKLTVEVATGWASVVSIEDSGVLTIDNCVLNVDSGNNLANGVFVQGYDPVTEYTTGKGATANTHAGAVKITNTSFNIGGTRPTAIGSQILTATDFAEIFVSGSLDGNTYNGAYVFRQNDFVPVTGTQLRDWNIQNNALIAAQLAFIPSGESIIRATLHSYQDENNLNLDRVQTYDVFKKMGDSTYTVTMTWLSNSDIDKVLESIYGQEAYIKATSVNITLPDGGVTMKERGYMTIAANTTVSGSITGVQSSWLMIEEGATYGGLDADTYSWHGGKWVDAPIIG